MTEWRKIKNYYITHPKASYRSLAEKYEVSLRQISRIAKEGKWPEKRKQSVNKMATKTLELAEERAIEREKRYQEAVDILLEKLLGSVKKLKAGDVDTAKKLTSALKDIGDIQKRQDGAETESSVNLQFIDSTEEKTEWAQ